MFIANKDLEVKQHTEFFPNTSFPPVVTMDMFDGYYPVSAFLEHDRNTEKLEFSTPYLQEGTVYTVKVVPLSEEEIAYKNRVIVPQVVSARQARIALHRAGMLEAINTAVAGNAEWAITWEFATEVQRSNPIIAAVADQLGKTPEDIDQLFVEAGKL